MRLAQVGAGAALSLVCVVVGCSQSPSHSSLGSAPGDSPRTSSTTQAIQGGTLDGTAHPYAVGVCGGSPGNCQEFCSGALILPNVVVTARHCVNQTDHIINCDANPVFGAQQGANYITTDPSMKQGGSGWHQVKQLSVPNDDHICGNDIALLILADTIDPSEATPVIPGVQYPMTDFDRWPFRKIAAIGYGNTGPTGFSAGIRHFRGNIPIACIPGDDYIPCPDGFNPNEFYTGDGTCEGDSGSSAFDDRSVTQGKPISFGVLSRGGDNGTATTAPTLCKGGLYTRLDKWRDLIVQTADAASNNWTLYPKPVPDWTIYVPPPPDAGAPEAGPKPKVPQGDGVACEINADCKSNVCADTGLGKACTVSCDETVVPTTCQDGFICKDSVCVQGSAEPPPAAASTPQTTTTTGCSVAAGAAGTAGSARGSQDPFRVLGIAAAAALVLGVRRRRGASR